MKTGLVLEGGAMRGMYTAGALDVFLKEGVHFQGVMGVSAGALFGVNFLSGQAGRVIRYCKKYKGNNSCANRFFSGLLVLCAHRLTDFNRCAHCKPDDYHRQHMRHLTAD